MNIDARHCDTIRDFRNIITVFYNANIKIEEAKISEKLLQGYVANKTMEQQYQMRNSALRGDIITLDGIPCIVEKEKSAMSLLLSNVGSRGECKGCGLSIWWVKHTNGKNVPYTDQGTNHFIDCPEADNFRRKP